MIKIELLGTAAQLEDNVWKCDNEQIQSVLNANTDVYNLLPQPYTPDRDYSIASRVCDVMGGKITHHDKQEFDPDVIY
jgi:hypothetical protein